jgi:hypothetical protein
MGWTPPHLSASMCQTEIDISVNDKEESAMKINRVGVDLAKNVFQLHGVDRKGKALWKRRLTRGKWLAVLCDTVEPGTDTERITVSSPVNDPTETLSAKIRMAALCCGFNRSTGRIENKKPGLSNSGGGERFFRLI